MRVSYRHLLSFVILHSSFCILLPPAARAADVWTLMSADLSTRAVQLKSIDAAGVHVANADGNNERVVSMDQFVELERPLPAAAAAGKFTLHLTTGDRLVGEPVGFKGSSALVWKHPVLGDVAVPVLQLKAMAKAKVQVGDERRKEDVVVLANKDVVRGAVEDLSGTKLTVRTDAGPSDLPLDSVESIGFAATAATPGAADKVGYRVGLDDGSTIVGSAVEAAGDKVKLTLADGPRTVDLARVTNIEQVNGPVSWLSSRPPGESVFVPYLTSSREFPARMNLSVNGDPIRFKDRIFARGIGVHAYSRIVYPLDGKTFTAFRTRYAVDPVNGFQGADCTVRVKLDDKVVHEQQHVRPGALSPPVVVDLNGGKSLALEVDWGDGIGSGACLNWIEPALLKVKPAPEPSAPVAPVTQPTIEPAGR